MIFKKKNGFTLIELIIVVTILAIISTLALPYFHEIMAQQEMKKIIHKLTSSIQLAKSHAAIEHRNVVICPSSDHLNCQNNKWSSGFISFVDNNKNKQVDRDEKIIFIESTNLKYGNLDWRGTLSTPSLTFQAENGLPRGFNGSFYYCSTLYVQKHQRIILSPMGHTRTEKLSNC